MRVSLLVVALGSGVRVVLLLLLVLVLLRGRLLGGRLFLLLLLLLLLRLLLLLDKSNAMLRLKYWMNFREECIHLLLRR